MMRPLSSISGKLIALAIPGVVVFGGIVLLLSHSVAPRRNLNFHSSGNRFNSNAAPRTAVLKWSASTSRNVVGYNVYRSFASRNGYVALNSHPIDGLSYVDSTVSSGQTYYYVLTAVDGQKNESGYSEEIQMRIP